MSIIACDTETVGLNSFKDSRPYIVSFCDFNMRTWSFRFDVNGYTRGIEFDAETYKNLMDTFDQYKDATWVFHNAIFDLQMLESIGVKTCSMKIQDTLIMSKIIHGGLGMVRHGLKPLSEKILGQSIDDEKALHDAVIQARRDAKAKQYICGDNYHCDYWMVEDGSDTTYAELDASRTMSLYKNFVKKIKRNPDHLEVYKREMAVFPVFKRMMRRGMRVLPELMSKTRSWNQAYALKQVEAMKKLGFDPENPNSNAQRVKYFFEEKGLPVTKLTAKGNPCLDKSVLADLAVTDKVAEVLIEYDTANKMISSFLDTYGRFRVYDKDEGIHIIRPGYKQCGAITGRAICSEPNLLQVASENSASRVSKAKLTPRKLFGVRPNQCWIAADYSQMEIHIFAALSEDEDFISTMCSGKDCHLSVAEGIWGHRDDFKKNQKAYRKKAKSIMLGKLYGLGVKKLSASLGLKLSEGKKIVDEFNEAFPAVKRYSDKLSRQVRNEYKVVSPYKRTFYFDNVEFSYKAVNYFCQGSGADMAKEALIALNKFLIDKYPDSYIIALIYDEVLIETPHKIGSEGFEEIKNAMVRIMGEGSKRLKYPIQMPVTVSYTEKDWSSLKEIEL